MGSRRSKDISRYTSAATNGDISEISPVVIKLESDMKRLRSDLQHSRNRENELRDQIVCYMSSKSYYTRGHLKVHGRKFTFNFKKLGFSFSGEFYWESEDNLLKNK